MLLFIEVYVEMGISHFNAVFIKLLFDVVGNGVIYIPIIFGFGPHSYNVGNRVITVSGHGCKESRIAEDKINICGFFQRTEHLVNGCIVGC